MDFEVRQHQNAIGNFLLGGIISIFDHISILHSEVLCVAALGWWTCHGVSNLLHVSTPLFVVCPVTSI